MVGEPGSARPRCSSTPPAPPSGCGFCGRAASSPRRGCRSPGWRSCWAPHLSRSTIARAPGERARGGAGAWPSQCRRPFRHRRRDPQPAVGLGRRARRSLVLVDDGHLLDAPAPKRCCSPPAGCVADPIAVLLAVREGEPSLLDGADLRTLRLEGLRRRCRRCRMLPCGADPAAARRRPIAPARPGASSAGRRRRAATARPRARRARPRPGRRAGAGPRTAAPRPSASSQVGVVDEHAASGASSAHGGEQAERRRADREPLARRRRASASAPPSALGLGAGMRSSVPSAGRSSSSRPANGTRASASMPARPQHPHARRRARAAYSSSALLPMPGSPTSTSTPLCPTRASASSRSIAGAPLAPEQHRPSMPSPGELRTRWGP